MVRPRNDLLGKVPDEFLFHGQRRLRFLWNESEAVADAEDVGVNSHSGFAKGNAHHHVGRLAPHSRQGCQLFQGGA